MMAIKNNKVKKASVVTNGETVYIIFFFSAISVAYVCLCHFYPPERHFDYHINGNNSNESVGCSMEKLYTKTLIK